MSLKEGLSGASSCLCRNATTRHQPNHKEVGMRYLLWLLLFSALGCFGCSSSGAECARDADCPSTEACNLQTNQCTVRAACVSVQPGDGSIDAACSSDSQCNSSFCDLTSCSCADPGTCTLVTPGDGTEGALCSSDADCNSATCDRVLPCNPPDCVAATACRCSAGCSPVAGAGIGTQGAGDPCETTSQCSQEFYAAICKSQENEGCVCTAR
jgi:hypothetical protein